MFRNLRTFEVSFDSKTLVDAYGCILYTHCALALPRYVFEYTRVGFCKFFSIRYGFLRTSKHGLTNGNPRFFCANAQNIHPNKQGMEEAENPDQE